jgi:nucleosome binding factor SPN SPT16 subunit
MNYLKEKISELQTKLQSIGNNYHPEIVSEVYSKLLLYIEKYFPEDKPNFLRNIANLSLNFEI